MDQETQQTLFRIRSHLLHILVLNRDDEEQPKNLTLDDPPPLPLQATIEDEAADALREIDDYILKQHSRRSIMSALTDFIRGR